MAPKKKTKKASKAEVVEAEAIAPTPKAAEKVAPRDWANDPAWLRYLLNEFVELLPDPVVFADGADPERCAQLLGFVEHVNALVEDEAPGTDEEESE